MQMGTSNFVSRKRAIQSYLRFFGAYDSVAEAAREVDRKLKEGEITIGRPKGRRGWNVVVHPQEGRYMYELRQAKRCTPDLDIPF